MAGNVDMGAVLGQQLLQVAQVMEEQVDNEIRQLERMDEDDLEAIKRRRIGRTSVADPDPESGAF
jgi:hypothetical protein